MWRDYSTTVAQLPSMGDKCNEPSLQRLDPAL